MSAAEDTIASLREDGLRIIAVASVMMFAATVAVALRLLAKSSNENRLGFDDLMIGLALALFLAVEGLVIRSVVVGSRANSGSDPDYSLFLKLSWIYSLLYWSVIAPATASILFLYRRIFSAHRVFRTISSILIGLTGCWWISGTLCDALSYRPVEAYWNKSISGSFTIEYNYFWLASMIIEMLLETACLVLPIREVAKLNLTMKKKILITVIFLLGGLVLISGIVRIYYAWGQNDMTPGVIWLSVHCATALISACLPTYRPLFSNLAGAVSSTRRYISRSRSISSQHPSSSIGQSRNGESKVKSLESKKRSMRIETGRNAAVHETNETNGSVSSNGLHHKPSSMDEWALQPSTDLVNWPLGSEIQHTKRAQLEEERGQVHISDNRNEKPATT